MSQSMLKGRGYSLTVRSLKVVSCPQWNPLRVKTVVTLVVDSLEANHTLTNIQVLVTGKSQARGGLLSQVSDCSRLSHAVRIIPKETSELFWRGARPLSHLGLWTLPVTAWGDLIRLPPHNHINKVGVSRQSFLIYNEVHLPHVSLLQLV